MNEETISIICNECFSLIKEGGYYRFGSIICEKCKNEQYTEEEFQKAHEEGEIYWISLSDYEEDDDDDDEFFIF